jgi:hypothetical protein
VALHPLGGAGHKHSNLACQIKSPSLQSIRLSKQPTYGHKSLTEALKKEFGHLAGDQEQVLWYNVTAFFKEGSRFHKLAGDAVNEEKAVRIFRQR